MKKLTSEQKKKIIMKELNKMNPQSKREAWSFAAHLRKKFGWE